MTPNRIAGEHRGSPLSSGAALIVSTFVSAILALALAFASVRVSMRVAALACCVGWVVSGVAVLASPRRGRARTLMLVLVLSPLLTLAGALAWRVREFNERNPDARASLSPASMTPELLAHFSARAWRDVATLPPLAPEVKREVADLALKSTYKLLAFEPLRLEEDLSWDENPLKDRTWQWALHTTPAVPALAEAYERTKDARYLQAAERMVLDWIADNQRYWIEPPSPFSWHDHVMALRVRGWLPFWETWVRSPAATVDKAERMLSSIVLHGERLADAEYYNEGHNHGMEQDFALLAIAAAFPELTQAASWRALAARRLQLQVKTVISPAGVQLEHTPYYHVFTLEILADAQAFARRVGVPREELDLDPVLERMGRFTAMILQPDGTLPPVGDTPRDPPLGIDHRVLQHLAEKDLVLRYALTQGREGAPMARAVFYKDEGYAVFREQWPPGSDFRQSCYLFFTAAANQGRVHKQHDDLSFVLFGRGRELLADAGFHSNQYGDPEREYVTSTLAHNSVVVDGKGFTGWTASIDEAIDQPAFSLVKGSHSNYPGLIHRRTLLYLRPATIFVFDELSVSAGSQAVRHEFELLFHFGAGLAVSRGDGGHSVLAAEPGPGATLLHLEALGAGKGTAQIWSGSREPFRGWRAVGHRQLEPTPCASFRESGASALFVTRVTLLDTDAETQRREQEPASLSVQPETGALHIKWQTAAGARSMKIKLQGPVEVEL